ncbi:MAG: ribulose-phosphate 3-epimerase [Deltaproteobacteria bacterium]|jgi:ribulose-phosphate 3-epimerase|nr:ribulose-phosphate 3-epimerase [Deltaproteobacteria bacterium]
MCIIAPSILSADSGRLAQEIAAMEAAGADWLHLDIMDGHFVPNITFGPWVVEMAKKTAKIPLDVHLMVSDPLTYGPMFARAGADIVTIHTEATVHLHRALTAIREAGAKPGLVLNPATPLSAIEYSLDLVDLLVVMGVNPGFSGQPFIESTTQKVSNLTKFLQSRKLNIPIEVDGGVNDQNAPHLAKAGATVLVSGSHLFKSKDYRAAILNLRKLCQNP